MKLLISKYEEIIIVETTNRFKANRRDGVVVRAPALQSVCLWFISQVESYQTIFKNGIHSFPAWRLAHSDSVENKPASLLVVSWARHLTGCLHLCVADRWRGQAVYPAWWPSLTKGMHSEHELIRVNKAKLKKVVPLSSLTIANNNKVIFLKNMIFA